MRILGLQNIDYLTFSHLTFPFSKTPPRIRRRTLPCQPLNPPHRFPLFPLSCWCVKKTAISGPSLLPPSSAQTARFYAPQFWFHFLLFSFVRLFFPPPVLFPPPPLSFNPPSPKKEEFTTPNPTNMRQKNKSTQINNKENPYATTQPNTPTTNQLNQAHTQKRRKGKAKVTKRIHSPK